MRNIKLTIQYDGTNYNGWQIQPSGITIQEILQKAIKEITGEDTRVIGAGRTDAGVHAIEQVASFKISSGLSADVIKRALNANLPADIRIMDACCVELYFHPRYDARSKIYFYIISNSYITSPFLYRYAWRVPHRLDLEGMRYAAEFLRGRHDFSAFRASGCGARSPVRTILDITVEGSDTIRFMDVTIPGDLIRVRIEADAFLRHMARNIVGTIIEVGRGRIRPEEMKKIIASRDRRLAGPTAPAKGLFLEKVKY